MRGISIRNKEDFVAGLFYMGVGVAFAVGATNYKHGEAARMGPGYFPFWLGIFLVIIGAVVAASAARPKAASTRLPSLDIRSLAWVLGSLIVFALLLQPLGLAVSLVLMVMISSAASHEFEWKGALVSAVLLLIFSLAVFVYGINLQLPVWPAFID